MKPLNYYNISHIFNRLLALLHALNYVHIRLVFCIIFTNFISSVDSNTVLELSQNKTYTELFLPFIKFVIYYQVTTCCYVL
jgi:hypothetical protein